MIAEGVVSINLAADKNRGTAMWPLNARQFRLLESFN